MGEEELRICGQCRHYRTKAIANPFSRNLDVWTPDILEVKTKWEGEQNDLALRESQRFESG